MTSQSPSPQASFTVYVQYTYLKRKDSKCIFSNKKTATANVDWFVFVARPSGNVKVSKYESVIFFLFLYFYICTISPLYLYFCICIHIWGKTEWKCHSFQIWKCQLLSSASACLGDTCKHEQKQPKEKLFRVTMRKQGTAKEAARFAVLFQKISRPCNSAFLQKRNGSLEAKSWQWGRRIIGKLGEQTLAVIRCRNRRLIDLHQEDKCFFGVYHYGTAVNSHWRHFGRDALKTQIDTTAHSPGSTCNLVISLCQYAIGGHRVTDASNFPGHPPPPPPSPPPPSPPPPTALCWLILQHLPDTQLDTPPGERHCPRLMQS